MKKTCLLLLLCIGILYGYEGYRMLRADRPVNIRTEGTLSDIAEEVIAIPLETTSGCRLKYATRIKRDRNELFLVSDGQLYRFSSAGKFMNRVALHTHAPVIDYVVDPVEKQLIVMDSQENIHYYDYDGTWLQTKSIAGINPLKTPIRLLYYNRHIWLTTQALSSDAKNTGEPCVDRWLYKFDTTFHLVDTRKLEAADPGRFYLGACLSAELSVANGNIYAHSPSIQPDKLLKDTLYLMSHHQLNIHANYASVLPVCIAGRYLVSFYSNAADNKQNYAFCYDHQQKKAYHVTGGFKDNFYATGRVPDLQALDAYSNTFCYSRSGEAVKKAFPNRTEADNPVLFIVKMKA